MKKQLLLLTILVRRSSLPAIALAKAGCVGGAFLLLTSSTAQEYGWQDLSNVLPDASYSDVYAIGDEVWITSGSSETLYYNDAAGTTDFITYTTPGRFLCIHMLSSNEGYAGAESGRVYKTIDGGANWSLVGLTGASVNSITFPPTADTGYCCGQVGRIYSITSSGTTQMISGIVSNMKSITFPVSSSEGWVCGEDIILHYNGSQWIGQGSPSGTCSGIYFVDNNNGWAVGGNGGDGKIIHTVNGINWTLQTDPSPSSGELQKVFFLNAQEGWVVGNFGRILSTTDGGNTWNIENTGASGLLTGVHFTTSTNGYIVGNAGDAYKYGELNAVVEFDAGFDFEIFPNPAVDEFKVRSLKSKVGGATIELYDLNGRKLIDKQIPAGTEKFEMDVSHLKNGVYLCIIRTQDHSVTKKIIIK